jgi:hypothetical protein
MLALQLLRAKNNTALGSYAMVFSTTAAYSTAVGYAALGNAVTTGGSNTAVGRYALRQTTSGAALIPLWVMMHTLKHHRLQQHGCWLSGSYVNTTGSDNAAW